MCVGGAGRRSLSKEQFSLMKNVFPLGGNSKSGKKQFFDRFFPFSLIRHRFYYWLHGVALLVSSFSSRIPMFPIEAAAENRLAIYETLNVVRLVS